MYVPLVVYQFLHQNRPYPGIRGHAAFSPKQKKICFHLPYYHFLFENKRIQSRCRRFRFKTDAAVIPIAAMMMYHVQAFTEDSWKTYNIDTPV